MRKLLTMTLSALSLLCVSQNTRAQKQTDDDFCVWTSIEVEKSLGKRWSVNAEAEFRTRENSSQVARWGLKLGGDYSIIKKYLKVGAAYQFQYFHDLKYSDFQPRHRFIAYAQGKIKVARFTFALRERFQVTYKDDSDRIKSSGKIDTYKIDPEWTWRNRLKISYDIRNCKFTPSVSFETFYDLNNPDGNDFSSLRYSVGVSYKINKQHSVELSGILDHGINSSDAMDRYIASVSYSFSF